MIYAYAWLTPRQGDIDDLLEIVSASATTIEGERGNAGVSISRQGDSVLMAETWETEEDFTVHRNGTALATLTRKAQPHLSAPFVLADLNSWAF